MTLQWNRMGESSSAVFDVLPLGEGDEGGTIAVYVVNWKQDMAPIR